jgi:predicted DNA-binding protein
MEQKEDNITVSTRTKVARNFSVSIETNTRLENYLRKEFGSSYMVSAIIEKAIREFLDREEKNGQYQS